MTYTQVSYAVHERIATITLDRAESRNGFTVVMADELAAAFGAAEADADVRAIVLAANGKDFCVGMDLAAGGLADVEQPDWMEPATRVTRPMYASTKPVIAAIQGAAAGVGVTMTLPADYRLATLDARFGFVFARRGLYPEGGSTWFLPRIVGLGRAMDWMVSGRIFGAQEALTAGLVHSLHEPAELLPRAYDLAREIVTQCAPVSVAVIRQALLRMGGVDSPEAAFQLDSKLIAGCAQSPDAVEGIVSFLQRRPPEFTLNTPRDLPPFLPWLEPPGQEPPWPGPQ
ncbi:MAG: enoyl-CoA hydratase [Pseudonocardiales bacterium]|nr:MAG: enoyl-CoA hydratase [Pseudonocardiales bacterium]